MSTADFAPPSPAPGVTITNRRSLPFQAQAVTINSGPNFVVIQPDGYTVAPGWFGVVYPIQPSSAIAAFDITGPLQGTAPQGPTSQQSTSLEYTDQPTPPNPGTQLAPPAQQTSVLDFFFPNGGTTPTIFTGLAKTVLIGVVNLNNPSSNLTVVVDALIQGNFYNLVPQFSFGTGPMAHVGMGQGTSVAIGTSTFTSFLPQGFNVSLSGGASGAGLIEIRMLF